MPAIQPARLKQQAVLLAESYNRPAAFVRSLHHLLDFYSDRAHRTGQTATPRTLLQAYHVRPPVLRQLTLELAPYVENDPQAALDLCRTLWNESYLEFRLLAVSVLGRIGSEFSEPVLTQAITWLGARPENTLISAILEQGLGGIRKDRPDRMVEQIESWLGSGETYWQQVGLRALLLVIADPEYQSVPSFFRMVQPLVRNSPSALRPYVTGAVRALAGRSPQETAFFLRQCLQMPESPDTPWLIRRVLPELPAAQQERLRQALRGANEL